MSETLTCSCCGKPIADALQVEPHFGLPDLIFALPPTERKLLGTPGPARRAMISPDACVLDYENDTRKCFLRVVMPFPLIDGPRDAYHVGVWVVVSKAVFLAYAESVAEDMGGWPARVAPPVQLADQYAGHLANELVRRQGGPEWLQGVPRLFDRFVHVVTRRGRERWKAVFAPDDDHPLAVKQREGIEVAEALAWNRPLHRTGPRDPATASQNGAFN